MKMKRTTSRNKKQTMTVIARIENKEDEKVFTKEFQKMVRNCNHLLKNEIGYELITISGGTHSRQGE